jgi:hypothetical protein
MEARMSSHEESDPLGHLGHALDHLEQAWQGLSRDMQKLVGVVAFLVVLCGCCGLFGPPGSSASGSCNDELKLVRSFETTSRTNTSSVTSCDAGAVMTVRDVVDGFAVECRCPARLPLVEASFQVEGEGGGS